MSISTPNSPPTINTATTATPLSPPSTTTLSQALSFLGLGYGIAIALGFLVLLSTILLTSYLCFRRLRHTPSPPPPPTPQLPTTTPDGGIILPRIIFVAESSSSSSPSPSSSPNHPHHRNRSPSSIGLAQAVINSYPKFQFTKSNNNTGLNTICSICLCDYKESEMLRIMPDCNHSFHILCLDAWLRLNGSCPVCRNSPLPTPLSTPLAEVVPLAQYGDNRRRRR